MLSALIFIIALIFPKPIYSATLSATGSATVSATVPAQANPTPPNSPILISPDNNSTTSTATPTFIFEPSTGTVAVSHYQLWIDGSKNTDHITNSLLTLTTNALTSLSEGQHTWFIKAIGLTGAQKASATWAFTVDTTAPLILINQIDQTPANLSSQDLASFSPSPIFETYRRYPEFKGIGEANASLTISLSNHLNTTTFSTTILSDNSFTLKPSIALNPGQYTVSVSSIDPSGNTTSLPSFTLNVLLATSAGSITLPLPSPLTNITITIPPLPFLPRQALPHILTAYPISLPQPSYLPWLIILLLTIHLTQILKLFFLKPDSACLWLSTSTKLKLQSSLIASIVLLIYLSLATAHLIPVTLVVITLSILIIENKAIRKKRS